MYLHGTSDILEDEIGVFSPGLGECGCISRVTEGGVVGGNRPHTEMEKTGVTVSLHTQCYSGIKLANKS